MQETTTTTSVMSPYHQVTVKYEPSPLSVSSRTPSPMMMVPEVSEDEISVGCPSPMPGSSPGKSQCARCDDADEYFRPLKRLKMVAGERRISPTMDEEEVVDEERSECNNSGVKSFSIADILSHRPATAAKAAPARIVRPWDLDPDVDVAHQNQLERIHRHLKVQQLALLRPEFAATFNASYASETGSDRSSSVASDCCSPDLVPTTIAHRHHHQHTTPATRTPSKTTPSGTPLDALFQMTSKTFDSNAGGESSADGQSHLNLFNNRQQPKKKRKSRTAFTNHQIFELEKRFLYQKYLSPADRDEIASSLGLTNAQVITWFQNRRAKLKRDMEELKKDVESAKILTAHKSFLENVQDLGILKKKAMMAAATAAAAAATTTDDECPKNLVIAHDK